MLVGFLKKMFLLGKIKTNNPVCCLPNHFENLTEPDACRCLTIRCRQHLGEVKVASKFSMDMDRTETRAPGQLNKGHRNQLGQAQEAVTVKI